MKVTATAKTSFHGFCLYGSTIDHCIELIEYLTPLGIQWYAYVFKYR